MNWKETDERTVLHMMGYGGNIFTLEHFKDAVENYNCDRLTLLYLIDYYENQWGSNDDVMIIGNYLENLHLTEQHKIEKKFRSDNQ